MQQICDLHCGLPHCFRDRPAWNPASALGTLAFCKTTVGHETYATLSFVCAFSGDLVGYETTIKAQTLFKERCHFNCQVRELVYPSVLLLPPLDLRHLGTCACIDAGQSKCLVALRKLHFRTSGPRTKTRPSLTHSRVKTYHVATVTGNIHPLSTIQPH